MERGWPVACEVIRDLDLSSLAVIANRVIRSASPVVGMRDEEGSIEVHDEITCETAKLWGYVDPEQIAFLVHKMAHYEWEENPEEVEGFYGQSVEKILLESIYELLCEDLHEILQLKVSLPGQPLPEFTLKLINNDEDVIESIMDEATDFMDLMDSMDDDDDDWDEDEEDDNDNQSWNGRGAVYHDDMYEPKEEYSDSYGGVEEPSFSSSYSFNDDEDDDDEDFDDAVITRMLDKEVWRENNLVKGFIVEVTGENAALYREDDESEERLVIPQILDLLNKIRETAPGIWQEHQPGWNFRLMPKKLIDCL